MTHPLPGTTDWVADLGLESVRTLGSQRAAVSDQPACRAPMCARRAANTAQKTK